MQERRTTVRVDHTCHTQYCAADDPLPKDGSLTNVSERGARALLREHRKVGDRVTVNFPLSAPHQSVTATGIVRWNVDAQAARWYPVGLEWLPFEEATAHLLHRFLLGASRIGGAKSPEHSGMAEEDAPQARRVAITWGSLSAFVTAVLCGIILATFHDRNQRLNRVLQTRDSTVEQLQTHRQQLLSQLEASTAHLNETTDQIVRLQTQAEALDGSAQQLRQEVVHAQEAYLELQHQRSGLIDRVVELEQERGMLLQGSISLDELQRAIRETVARRQASQAFFSQAMAEVEEDRGPLAGNHGYLVQDGLNTFPARPTLEVRVYEPYPED